MLRLHLRLRLRLRLLHMLTAPVEVRMQAGPHVIVGTLPGRETDRREIEITDDTEVHLTLLPTLEHQPEQPERIPTTTNYVVGGALFAGGLAISVGPLLSLVRSGDCISHCDDAERVRRYDAGGQSKWLLTLGSLLIVTGIVFTLARPIRATVSAGSQSAQFSLEGMF